MHALPGVGGAGASRSDRPGSVQRANVSAGKATADRGGDIGRWPRINHARWVVVGRRREDDPRPIKGVERIAESGADKHLGLRARSG